MSPDAAAPDVAIVGGGPAGLGAALALRARGVERVMVLEREAEAGGIPRQCGHPPYGLREFGRIMTGPAYAARLREAARAAGVELRTRHSVVALEAGPALRVASPDGIAAIVPRRVILATGARERSRAARFLSGDRPAGVVNTAVLQDAVYLKGLRLFERPVIVGSELVALSAVWTCARHGIAPAAVIEAGPRAVARFPLGLFPRLLGIPTFYGAVVAEIVGRDRAEAVCLRLADGGERRIACDGVILSGDFLPEAALPRAAHLLLDPATGGPVIDRYGRCADPAVFACGNLLRPIETAGWCYREGRRIGDAVADDLARPRPPATVPALPGEGVRWVVPQRIAAGDTPVLALRATGAIAGRLTVRQDGRLLWSRRIRTRAERRLALPARALRGVAGDAPVTIAIER